MAYGLDKGKRNPITRPLIALVFTAFVCACASPERMQSRDYNVGGPVPAMDASRKMNEQDCTKPIDLAAGNLRCK